jgi:hypothetical protein
MYCLVCDNEFDPISHRWLCPNCKTKHNCCEGEPQAMADKHGDPTAQEVKEWSRKDLERHREEQKKK